MEIVALFGLGAIAFIVLALQVDDESGCLLLIVGVVFGLLALAAFRMNALS